MRIVFMGTPKFASDILHEILSVENLDVVGVFTKEDSVSKRGNKLIPSPTKIEAQEHGAQVFTPKTLKDAVVIETLETLNPDVICVAAYGKILPKSVLEIPKHECLNVHASLLPRWRGAAPIERAILSGDKTQGVSIMKMEEGLDTGDYSSQVEVDANGKDVSQLTNGLAQAGARALIEVLKSLDEGNEIEWIKQDEAGVTYAEKIEKKELFLSPEADAVTNYRRVLASADSHPSKCVVAKKTVRLTSAEVAGEINVEKGKVVFKNKKLFLGCENGALKVIKLKPDGKKEMDAMSFVAGNPQIREGNATWSEL